MNIFYTLLKQIFRRQHKIMTALVPPESVKEMKIFDKDAFTRNVNLITLTIPMDKSQSFLPKIKKNLVKLKNFKSILERKDSAEQEFLLNPAMVDSVEKATDLASKVNSEVPCRVGIKEVEVSYDNWSKDDIIAAVLPEGVQGFSAFTTVGHIIQLNLKEHMEPYKYVIAQVLLDKLPCCQLVINKTNNIDNEFRSFKMEKLAGDADTLTTCSENGFNYTFDFAHVYWNSRLSTEHFRITEQLKHGDVLFDVMAGVGPFSIPCAKKGCQVFCNDLNPSSYQYLVINAKKSKVNDRLQHFNLDGNEFIKTVIKDELSNLYRNSEFTGNIHITMNLPSIATSFLTSFKSLLSDHPPLQKNHNLPLVHCYLFAFNSSNEYAIHRVASPLGYCKGNLSITEENEGDFSSSDIHADIVHSFHSYIAEVFKVRKVSNNKWMMRVSFKLPEEVLMSVDTVSIEPPSKKIKAL